MAMTERLVVLLDAGEKASLKSRAASAQLSMGEYVKRAVSSYDAAAVSNMPLAELDTLAGELAQAAAHMSGQLDAAVARIDAVLDPGREAALRARLETEARALPDAAIAGVASLFGIRSAIVA